MSRVHEPCSLEETCYVSVANNLHSYWCKEYDEQQMDKYRFRYVLGPFSSLPVCMLTRLLDTVRRHHQLKPAYLPLFLQPSLSQLSLSGRAGSVSAGMLTCVADNCCRLQRLDLSRVGKLALQPLLRVLVVQTQLSWLSLEGTSASDRVMSVLGSHCPHLRHLDVRNTQVSDLGISALCTHVPEDETSAAPRACHSLHALLQDGSLVEDTVDACVAILTRLRHLRRLDHARTMEAVAWMSERGRTSDCSDGGDTWTLPLETLSGDCVSVAVQAAARCPQLTRLTLFLSEPACLHPLAPHACRLTHLSIIQLTQCDAPETAGINAVLEAAAAQLKQLELSRVRGVSVALLLNSCRQLQNISLELCSFNTQQQHEHEATDGTSCHGDDEGRGCFQQLETLSLLTRETAHEQPDSVAREIPASLLRQMIGGRCVKHITLTCCPEFNDLLVAQLLGRDVTMAGWRSGGDRAVFSQLRSLRLQRCDGLSARSALALLSRSPRLELLEMHECRNISLANVQRMQAHVRAKQWRVQLEWS